MKEAVEAVFEEKIMASLCFTRLLKFQKEVPPGGGSFFAFFS